MSSIYMSKSKYCKAQQCNKILWLDKNKPEEAISKARDSIMENGSKVGELARQYFRDYIHIDFDENLSNMVEHTNPKYKKQAEIELSNDVIIKKEEIREFMKTLSYPIYFLDFETYQAPIPEYDGTWAYEQIPFQYSLHYIEKEGGELKHKEFLAESGVDPRRILAERLIEDIPVNVCVTAYNMGFEKGRIKEMAKQFTDLSEHLMNIHDNIKDLMLPFSNRWYYCKEMQGSYSIKYVLPALFPNDLELDYHNLPVVHNGGEASQAFIDLSKSTKEEQEEIRKGLLLYCGLDTLAMVKVWERLKEVER